jgi:hypothetical protein
VVDQPSPNNRVSKGVGERGPEANVCGVALFLFSQYIAVMLSRVRNSRGRPSNAPAAFIHPCQSVVAKQNGRYATTETTAVNNTSPCTRGTRVIAST